MDNLVHRLIAGILAFILITGCVASRQESGALTGAVVGAAVGSTVGRGKGRALAIWLGALVGASIGSAIGQHMDDHDRLKTANVLETQRTNVSTTWVNPDTSNSYTVTPVKTYTMSSGTPCREFTLDAKIGGKIEEIYGTACRQADGSWKVIE